MATSEAAIEKNLIDQLCNGSSQWTYRPDIRTEEDLWANFKKILEQNNKARLNDTPLSESEFAKVKNDLSHSSFYEAGRWLVGENGRVYVHVQRGNETLHLVVLNNEHIAGGSSVYEVINQYEAFKDDEDVNSRNRRFDVTLLINGIPMIHIELKNQDHSYMDGFWQIRDYIREGKFKGLFSNVQLFVISNAVDTKYFAPARDTDLNKKFTFHWLDRENRVVANYLDFAGSVLKIPEAHEMVSKYVVLDEDKRQLIILRPYQIHAIEAIREASKRGQSGYVWHTTGSGKTMTSYKATRNLLMDIPSIDKSIFLIDRKDLDEKTKGDFQSYAVNDTIDVMDTDNVDTLIKRLTDGTRSMIVTTRQKMQFMFKRLKEDSKEYNTIKKLKIAFVVDECHRTISRETKREFERFFKDSLWYGFTGTPIKEENAFEVMGDLPRTTEEMYGPCLNSYTIKEAIHDEAVLGFMVENLGPTGLDPEEEGAAYLTDAHMRSVLDVILNKSFNKFGLQKGRGKTYEAILTVPSIQRAQEYYSLLKKVKAGEDSLKISEEVHQALPDFPKFALTYSLSDDQEASGVNQQKMVEALSDYNDMFHKSYTVENISAYNDNLNERLARKKDIYKVDRDEQLDLVIVVDRLLTGFDAPCLSTVFMDRPPMKPQDIIQTMSRTNRLFDEGKENGQIVTFQYPETFKKAIDSAIALYSKEIDGMTKPITEDFDKVRTDFNISVKAVHGLGETPQDIINLSKEQKRGFVHLFQDLDSAFSHLQAFTQYAEKSKEILEAAHFSQEEYQTYAAVYKNVLAELRKPKEGGDDNPPEVDDHYELKAFYRVKIDFAYIVELLQGFIEYITTNEEDMDDSAFSEKMEQIREIINDYIGDNPRLGALLLDILEQIGQDRTRFMGQDISEIINEARYSAIDTEIRRFAEKWFLDYQAARYEALNFHDGQFANENKLKDSADYAAYKAENPEGMPKFKFRKAMVDDFKENLMGEIGPLMEG